MIDLFPMKMFGQNRMIRVYLPPAYARSEKSYPVLYVHDGQNVFSDSTAVGGGVSLNLEEFLDRNEYGLIVAAIDLNTAGEERIHELCPWKCGHFCAEVLGQPSSAGGKGEAYLDFIVNELKPALDRLYRTDSERSYMAGISLGGSFTVYAACRYPDIFKRAAGLSSGFYRNQEELENLIESADLSGMERLYLDCGTNENPDIRIRESFLESNKRIFQKLDGKVQNQRFSIIPDGIHHYSSFRSRFPEVLDYLLK
ncbi:alpha/beta hydrolase [Bacillus mangrovi]|uniref:Alpha/beta hydrolase n=1 Tax=Metabacillus mangrovi TaxID=1491830 RepID=A0A7X2S222_9BACI|nr:alpha/beta hydrolase-fold protein [Metabacillus mangrovi]MTH52284.1 alpha/beta hydrolase [Metabacillus mangrovi]